MIASYTDAYLGASIDLGGRSYRCCYSPTSRMPGAFGAIHPEEQSEPGPGGRSRHDEQASH